MEKILEFLHKIGHLKKVKRTGWVLFKVPNAESVAEHSFRTAMMAYLLADDIDADRDRVLKMALIHDIGESLIGDIAVIDPDYKNKVAKEREALKTLTAMLDKEDGKEFMELWEEYEARKTKEAQLVYAVDKLEMIFQAFEYESEHGKKINLEGFWTSIKQKIDSGEIIDKTVIKLFDALAKKRKI